MDSDIISRANLFSFRRCECVVVRGFRSEDVPARMFFWVSIAVLGFDGVVGRASLEMSVALPMMVSMLWSMVIVKLWRGVPGAEDGATTR